MLGDQIGRGLSVLAVCTGRKYMPMVGLEAYLTPWNGVLGEPWENKGFAVLGIMCGESHSWTVSTPDPAGRRVEAWRSLSPPYHQALVPWLDSLCVEGKRAAWPRDSCCQDMFLTCIV